jgi:3',5'-cyclic AMP phosphodiesterase CpdA
MKLVILSDTHCQQIPVPDGDVLIHCGDHTYKGTVPESDPALQWLVDQPHKHKIIIAGNHECGWEDDLSRNSYRAPSEVHTKPRHLDKFPELIYLHNTGIKIGGIKFWGSPYQPHFYNWAFQKSRGEELKRHWSAIPDDTDVLITHGPPYGFGDTNPRDERFGDEDLLKRVLEVKPTIHCYGHAHNGYGERFFEGIHFINAAILNEGYQVANKPVEVEI